MSRRKILILTSKTGGGHESIAQAVKESLAKDFQVEIYDAYSTLGAQLYGYIHLYLPTFFNYFYRLSENRPSAGFLHFLAFLLNFHKLKKVKYENYDLIFSVQPFLTQEVLWLIKKPKFVYLLNDPLTFSQANICPQADLLFVATPEAKSKCLKKGMAKEKVVVSGFPVREQFFKVKPKKKKQLTIFIGGSGYGLRETISLVKQLANSGLQLIVVCGRNSRIKRKLPQGKNIKVFGFVANMAKLMAQADLIVGKAGPNLLFESVSLNIPFLATGYPPEQEKGNLELIKKCQLGFVEENPKKAAALIRKLSRNPQKLRALKPKIRKFAAPHRQASLIILASINHLFKNSTAAKRR